MKVNGRASRPVVTHDRTCYASGRRDGHEVMEVAPSRRKEERTEGGYRRPLPDRGDGYKVMEVTPRGREEREG